MGTPEEQMIREIRDAERKTIIAELERFAWFRLSLIEAIRKLKDEGKMKIENCPKCGGTHFGSYVCPFTEEQIEAMKPKSKSNDKSEH